MTGLLLDADTEDDKKKGAYISFLVYGIFCLIAVVLSLMLKEDLKRQRAEMLKKSKQNLR